MDDMLTILAGLLVYAVAFLLPGAAFSFLLHFLLSMPMQRRSHGAPAQCHSSM